MTLVLQTLGLPDNVIGVYSGGVVPTVNPVPEVGPETTVTHAQQTLDLMDNVTPAWLDGLDPTVTLVLEAGLDLNVMLCLRVEWKRL